MASARFALVASFALASGCASAAPSEPPPDDVALASFDAWAALPTLGGGAYRQDSSHDRDPAKRTAGISAGNKDFDSALAVCGARAPLVAQSSDDAPVCAAGIEGWVIAADDAGPGMITRLYLAMGTVLPSGEATLEPDSERVRIYLDDLTTPAFDLGLAELRAGSTAPFVPPLVTWNEGALVSYAPLAYASRMRVVLDSLGPTTLYYDQVDHRSVDATSAGSLASLSAAGLAGKLARLHDEVRRVAGRELVVERDVTVPARGALEAASVEGAATLSSLVLTLPSPASIADLDLALRWDDEAKPAIDLPLAWLFAETPTLGPFDTLPASAALVGGAAVLTLALPMPFESSARLSLTNRGAADARVVVTLAGDRALPAAPFGRLRARRAESLAPMAPGSRFVVADLTGPGKYVGTVLLLEGHADGGEQPQSPFNFLEGDESMTIDGAVATLGTGTEEYVNGGWYFAGGRYDSPFATLVASGVDASGTLGHVAAMRWHVLADAVPFASSFRLDLEYGASTPAAATAYRAVALYYAP